LLLWAISLAACQPGAASQTDAITPVQAKLLATVYVSPTPDAAQQQATRQASVPTLTAPPPTLLPPATVYVGTFLEPAGDDEAPPILDATQVFALIPGLPTERPSRCQFEVDPRFGEDWRSDPAVNQAMACPIETATDFSGVVQVFEHGVMYYQANGPIWAIETTNDGFPNRHWTITHTLPQVEGTPPVTAPEGLKVPAFGFGSVWFGVSGVREAIGFARTDEQAVSLAFQRFEGGTLFLDAGGEVVFALLVDGTAYGPF
jgi:hypothetical protein